LINLSSISEDSYKNEVESVINRMQTRKEELFKDNRDRIERLLK